MTHASLILRVCRSCGRDNPQCDPVFETEAELKKLYEKKLKTGFFGALADLTIVDCLNFCDEPNTVEIERDDGRMALTRICTREKVDEVITLLKTLRDAKTPFAASEKLKSHVATVKMKLRTP